MFTPSAQSTMAEIQEALPGARRALFRRYHIGGCSSCGFHPTETLASLCQRNENLNVQEVIQHLLTSHEQDEASWISPHELDVLRKENPKLKLVDLRPREEHEAVTIAGAMLLTQESMTSLMADHPRDQLLVLFDHTGSGALDAAAYYAGHGFQKVRCLRGGIDAWSGEVDPKLPRYRVE